MAKLQALKVKELDVSGSLVLSNSVTYSDQQIVSGHVRILHRAPELQVMLNIRKYSGVLQEIFKTAIEAVRISNNRPKSYGPRARSRSREGRYDALCEISGDQTTFFLRGRAWYTSRTGKPANDIISQVR